MLAVKNASDDDPAAPADERALFHCQHRGAEGRLAIARLDGYGEFAPLRKVPVEPSYEWVPLRVIVGGNEDLPDPARWGLDGGGALNGSHVMFLPRLSRILVV